MTDEDLERQQDIGFLVRELANELRRHRECGVQGENGRLTMMQCWVIGYLAHHKDHDIYQREVEESLKIGKSTLTEVLHLMEKNELVNREPVENDKRLKRIVMTEKSRQIDEAIAVKIRENENKLKEDIPTEDLEVFKKTMRHMIANMKKDCPTAKRKEQETESIHF